ncbi:MAG TPA: ribonuclease E/G, partial [Gemmatimonadaceae bacterium]|nr:ribonuclease E/G [Gemmatimonadaceae bacterium]
MNKELFVSSTPHETKVGLVEDDLLAEIYMERENEYTLAGSIYKGRVTRVLPGMQSAFVDIGLERDAFLYVSDFMELEEHDDDLTDVVPASRSVQDMRQDTRPPVQTESAPGVMEADAAGPEAISQVDAEEGSFEADNLGDTSSMASTSSVPEPGNSADSQNRDRDRGGFRGRRRRRGGRRDGRERGQDRGADRGPERGPERSSEPRLSRPAAESAPPRQDFTRTQPSGPPPGYTPMLLPGESISKYQRYAQQPSAPPVQFAVSEIPEEAPAEPATPVAATFPEDEPIFAASDSVAEPLHEEHEDIQPVQEEPAESASTSTDWNHEFRRPEEATIPTLGWPGEQLAAIEQDEVHEGEVESDTPSSEPAHSSVTSREEETPVFAAPGTLEEETIDEEEADAVHYESSSDDGYEEFEEETQAGPGHLNGDARETVSEIHMASIADSGETPAAEATHPEGEEDSEELELEEAQAEAEAMLDAEARGNGTVDARVEVRAPAATAGYTQRTQRPRPGQDRPGYERRGGDRGRRGGGGRSRFRRRESAPVPLISDLLKEGQEILVQIAKEPIGKKGARITSHIALPGRFLVYMPTVNHTGVSRKISSEEERQRLKRIILSERENGHGGFIVRTAAQSASEDELRADIRFLKGLWQDIKNRAESSKPPALIYHDLNVVERVLRDQVTSDFSVIWVDTEP